MLSRVFAAAASQWQASDQRVDTFRDARAALQIITRDLSRADINGDPQMLTLTSSDPSGFFKEAYAITPIGNDGKSDLCGVGYYTVWDPATKAYTLKRLIKNSDTIFNDLKTSNFTSIFSKNAANEEDVAAYVWDLRFYPGVQGDPQNPPTGPSSQWRWVEVRFKSMSAASARKIRSLPVGQGTWSNPSDPLYKAAILRTNSNS